ncbi:hypothetical protein NUSPORA_01010 [Nucleospora cyclopteri]
MTKILKKEKKNNTIRNDELEQIEKEVEMEFDRIYKKVESSLNNSIHCTEIEEFKPDLNFDEIYTLMGSISKIYNEHTNGNKINFEKIKKKITKNINYMEILNKKSPVVIKEQSLLVSNKLIGFVSHPVNPIWNENLIDELINQFK